MKYLTKFKNYLKHRKNKPSREDIQDIVFELEDIGIIVRVVNEASRGEVAYILGSFALPYAYIPDDWSQIKYMAWDDIKDCILRLKDYLGNKFLHFRYSTYVEERRAYGIMGPPFDDDDRISLRLVITACDDVNDDTKIEVPIYQFELSYKVVS